MPKPPSSEWESTIESPQYPGRRWMDQYLRGTSRDRGFSASSRRAYESVWRSFLIYLAERGADPLTADARHLRGFLKRYRAATALRYGRLLERVYAQQVAKGVLSSNPFSALPGVLAQEEPRSPSVALEISDVSRLIAAFPEPADWQEHRDQAVVILAASAGLRLRELRELETLQLVPTSSGLEVQPRGRTVTSREISLEPAAGEFLNRWLEVRRALVFPSHSRLAFPGKKGEPIPVNTLYRRVRALLQSLYGANTLPRFGVGVLRASFAHELKRRDALVEAQHALGHRRITSTLRYFRHLNPVRQKPRRP